MRHNATRLEQARSDDTARNMVRLMRSIADDMERGELWDDDT